MSTENTPLSAEQVADMVAHMNDDHADSVLAYAQHYGACRAATAAVLLDVSPDAMRLRVQLPEAEREIAIAFDHRLESAHDAHMTMIRMSKAAKRALSEAHPV